MLEETGLVVLLQKVAGCAEFELPDRKVAYLILEGRVQSGQLRLNDEHDAFGWVPIAELPRRDIAEQFQKSALDYARSKAG